MLNKTIFKQTFKSNIKIWMIITLALSIFNILLIGVFDPKTISSMSDMVKDTPLSNFLGNTTFLGMLSQTFFSLHGVLLPVIYIIITASSLVVNHVDRGSMAYLLSTPIKRIQVVRTQLIYFILALTMMFSVATGVGILAIQSFHGGIWGNGYTTDIKAIASEFNLDRDALTESLYDILKNEAQLEIGAESREIDIENYRLYLSLKIMDNMNIETASILGVEVAEVEDNPLIILDNQQALELGAKILNMDQQTFSAYLKTYTAEKQAKVEQSKAMQDKLLTGLTAAAESLSMSEEDLVGDISILKENMDAFNAAVVASEIPEPMFKMMIDQQIAANELSMDHGMDIDFEAYLLLNGGLYLLMLSTGSISFMFSCIFNLTKNYMALGAGLPIAFFLFEMMAQVSDSLDFMKYVTMNSLFDKDAILSGEGYLAKLLILLGIAVLFNSIGLIVFKEKDLPL